MAYSFFGAKTFEAREDQRTHLAGATVSDRRAPSVASPERSEGWAGQTRPPRGCSASTRDRAGGIPASSAAAAPRLAASGHQDRKSTRLNSSHSQISYAV